MGRKNRKVRGPKKATRRIVLIDFSEANFEAWARHRLAEDG